MLYLETADDQDLQIAVGLEVAGSKLQSVGSGRFQAARTKADQAVASSGIDGQLEGVDRSGPIGAGPEHVADPSLCDHGRVGGFLAGAPVELGQECVGYAIFLSIPLHLGGKRFVVT